MNKFKLVSAAAALLAMMGSAHAGFIIGSISAGGLIANDAPAGSTNLVGPAVYGALTTQGASNITGTGDIASGSLASGSVLNVNMPGVLLAYSGFSITVTAPWPNPVTSAFSCQGPNANLCSQTQTYNVSGSIDDGAGGLDATAFFGSFTLSGSCTGSVANGCSTPANSSWALSGSSFAQAPTGIPEPTPLALVGLAMAGLALVRKARKA